MKSIFTWHLLAFSNSLAQRFRFSSDIGTKWFAANIVRVRVAAYSGGVLSAKLPVRPAVAAAAVCRNARRLMIGVVRNASTVIVVSSLVRYSNLSDLLLPLVVSMPVCSGVIVHTCTTAVNQKKS